MCHIRKTLEYINEIFRQITARRKTMKTDAVQYSRMVLVWVPPKLPYVRTRTAAVPKPHDLTHDVRAN